MKETTFNHRLDEMIRTYLSPLMKSRGFRKRGRYFYRHSGCYWYIINIQSSQWNEADRGRFTINIGRHDEQYDDDLRMTYPKEYECKPYARVRVGQLINGTDTWWEIDATTNTDELGVELRDLIEFKVFPCLEQWGTYPGVLWMSTVRGVPKDFPETGDQ